MLETGFGNAIIFPEGWEGCFLLRINEKEVLFASNISVFNIRLFLTIRFEYAKILYGIVVLFRFARINNFEI